MKYKKYILILIIILTAFINVSCQKNKHEYLARPPGGDGIWVDVREENEQEIPVQLVFEIESEGEWSEGGKKEFDSDFIITNAFLPSCCKGLDEAKSFRIKVYEGDKLVQKKSYSWE